ncbi:MAG TPA: hypothetical protein EYG69_01625 [Campylobacterales bacterium]|nr:hypothetical protein [Campylobacterales bacterium]
MNYQLLENFIKNRVRRGDIYVPATIVMMLKNGGSATVEEVARLLYIFEYKRSVKEYETIVKSFSFVLLDEYGLVTKDENNYSLKQWPLKEGEADKLVSICYEVTDGFFKNLDEGKAA